MNNLVIKNIASLFYHLFTCISIGFKKILYIIHKKYFLRVSYCVIYFILFKSRLLSSKKDGVTGNSPNRGNVDLKSTKGLPSPARGLKHDLLAPNRVRLNCTHCGLAKVKPHYRSVTLPFPKKFFVPKSFLGFLFTLSALGGDTRS